ncbi:MAG: GtrA family protein [Agathobacter sp.]|nr:GtrA family protein [Agathobacter sp.]
MFRNNALVLQYCKFAAVGITSLIVDYVFMVFLTENTAFGLDYFQACAFSYTLSVFVNYFLSMKYVFQSREDMGKVKEASIFFVLSLIGLFLNQMIMWFAVEILGIYYVAAKLLSTLLVTNYNFISRKKFFE